jgi:hypothetical protein
MLRLIVNGIEYFVSFIDDTLDMFLIGVKRRLSPIYQDVHHFYHPITRLLIIKGERTFYTFGVYHPTEDDIAQEINSYNFKYLLDNHSLIGSNR